MTDETVLITGETGTGKKLAAKMIHYFSSRSERPFITVNCPAIPESILESELFGYRRGAFTSAVSDKKGLIEVADGGTLFLDEIGDIPVSIQIKLLRFLQEKEFKPLGETGNRKVDVRVIASTNQDLEKKISRGDFREDLYYRLNVITIRMPSLSERREDIPLLAEFFLKRYAPQYNKRIKGFTDEAMKFLISKKWNGNVRELENTIKRAIIFSRGKLIGLGEFRSSNVADAGSSYEELTRLDYKTAKKKIVDDFTIRYLRALLTSTGGNVTKAARYAGMERQALQQLLRKHSIDPAEFRKVQ